MRYFTSDLHFYHKNVIKYCTRPYADVNEMNEMLIKNWNEVVRPEDEVYIMGDMFFCGSAKAEDILNRLMGTKILILGNHDWDLMKPHRIERFKITAVKSMTLEIDGQTVNMSHFPYLGGGDSSEEERFQKERLIDDGRILLCGHVHEIWATKDKMINVGVDVRDFKPMSEEQLIKIMRDIDGKKEDN